MKRLLLAVILHLLAATTVNSAGYQLIQGVTHNLEFKADQTFIQPAPKGTKTLYNILFKKYNLTHDRAVRFAQAFARTSDPLMLLVICHIESEFRDDLPVGKDGEVGCMQVIPKHWGDVPETLEGQIEQADKILQELSQTRSRFNAAMAYNGSGEQARLYRQRVIKEIRRLG